MAKNYKFSTSGSYKKARCQENNDKGYERAGGIHADIKEVATTVRDEELMDFVGARVADCGNPRCYISLLCCPDFCIMF